MIRGFTHACMCWTYLPPTRLQSEYLLLSRPEVDYLKIQKCMPCIICICMLARQPLTIGQGIVNLLNLDAWRGVLYVRSVARRRPTNFNYAAPQTTLRKSHLLPTYLHFFWMMICKCMRCQYPSDQLMMWQNIWITHHIPFSTSIQVHHHAGNDWPGAMVLDQIFTNR